MTLISDEINDVQWLRNNGSPLPEVIEKWRRTTKYRMGTLDTITIDTYLQTYPGLKTPLGYQLFAEDFATIHPGKEDALFTKWPLLYPTILKICASKQDRFLRETLNKYTSDASENNSNEGNCT